MCSPKNMLDLYVRVKTLDSHKLMRNMQCTHYCRFFFIQTVMLNKALLLQGRTHTSTRNTHGMMPGGEKVGWVV